VALMDRLERLARRASERRRRVWVGEGGLWCELRCRGGAPDEAAGERIAGRVSGAPGVAWARYNRPFQRLVVSPEEGVAPETLLEAVRGAERAEGLSRAPFSPDLPDHPGERYSRRRALIQAGASTGSLALGAGLRAAGAEVTRGEIDLAALNTALENMPQSRKALDRLLGGGAADMALSLASSLSQGLAQGNTGQPVDLVYRALRLRELRANRGTWEARAAALSSPEGHTLSPADPGPRPGKLPKGPVERYSERAAFASLGGFSFGVASTGEAEKATAPVFGLAPKPARVGREAFGAALGHALARRGVLVLDDRVLRRLDRIDTLVTAEGLLEPTQGELAEVLAARPEEQELVQRRANALFLAAEPEAPRAAGGWSLAPLEVALEGELAAAAAAWRRRGRWVLALRQGPRLAALVGVRAVVDAEERALVAEARHIGLTLIPVTARPERVSWFAPEEVIDPSGGAIEAVRALQRAGRGVAYVAAGPDPALRAADLGLGLHRAGAPAPWGADLIGEEGRGDLAFLVDAIGLARDASRQSAWLGLAEAAAGAALSLEGQEMSTLRRIMLTTNATSLAAVANGWRVARGLEERPRQRSRDRTAWHALEGDEVLTRLEVSAEGLSEEEALRRCPPEDIPIPPWAALVRFIGEEIANPFAPLLAGGAGLSALMGSTADAAMVAATVGISGVVGGVQRFRAERALTELGRQRPTQVRARRGGELRWVATNQLAVGDVIALEAGEHIPADCRVLEARALETDESSLTGESLPVAKSADPSFARALGDRSSMLYAGCSVAAGNALAVVVAVGADTAARQGTLGRSSEAPPTGVEARLAALTGLTAPVAGLAGLAVLASGLARQRPPSEIVGSAVSLTVAAVPETMPLLATAAQLAAARRLSAKGALVRNPRSVEALGRVEVLCADKTGTLTEGRIQLALVSDGVREVASGSLGGDDREVAAALRGVLAVAMRATPRAEGPLPHPTDQALADGAAAAGVEDGGAERLEELPFEPGRGYHATLHRREGASGEGPLGEAGASLAVKGSPEAVIARCRASRAGGREAPEPLDDDGREVLLTAARALAGRGLRVLAVADGPAPGGAQRSAEGGPSLSDQAVSGLVFRGFVGLADPVRPTSRGAIEALRSAGIATVMVTGDHPETARAIAAELGLGGGEILTGPELEALDDQGLAAALEGVSVFARVAPHHKVRIVRAFQRAGRVVAMTGDGANDAPAIRLADVGLALGEQSTAAARGVADVIITDGHIETIVEAVMEGRGLWRSVRDAVSLLVGGNLGEIGFSLVGGLVEGRSPLNMRQIMLVNLFTDALPALSIAVSPPSKVDPAALLAEGPERSLGASLDRDIAWRAVLTSSAATTAWIAGRAWGDARHANTVALLALVGAQLGQTLVSGGRHRQVLLPALGSAAALLAIVETPGLSGALGCKPLGPVGLAQAATATAAATAAAAAGPAAGRRIAARLEGSRAVARLRQSELARLLTDSRPALRLRRAAALLAEELED
jgi:cation-transporting ATPase I